MNEPGFRERLRKDASHLAEMGRYLREQFSSIEVRLPLELLNEAKAAWDREELEPLPPESYEQAIIRTLSGDFALIGLAATRDMRCDEAECVVRLAPGQVAHAIFAADLFDDLEPPTRQL